jgi:hypothetical protein
VLPETDRVDPVDTADRERPFAMAEFGAMLVRVQTRERSVVDLATVVTWHSVRKPGDGVPSSNDDAVPSRGVLNQVSGDTAGILQAGMITGGVHWHSAPPVYAPMIAARPITEWNPFDLGFHRAIMIFGRSGAVRLPDLPTYLRREHDDELNELLK